MVRHTDLSALCDVCADKWGFNPTQTQPFSVDKNGEQSIDHSIHYIGPDPGKCRGCGIKLGGLLNE